MALALAQYEDLFQLVSGYLYWRKNGLTNRVQCGLCLEIFTEQMMNTDDTDDVDAH